MVGIFALWLPIVLAAVAVFITSSVMHMLLPHHRKDFRKVPDEDGVMSALRPFNIPPGDYVLPNTEGDTAAMKTDAFKEKLDKGPLVVMTVMPKGAFSDMMGKTLAVWFVYLLVVSSLVAYVAELAFGPGAAYMEVFRFTGTVAFGFYAAATWTQHIWYKSSGMTAFKSTVDSFVYGLMTAGVFGWLWP
ncbi:MAG TPA: hypothetical protein VLA36_11275 [Longimicrobiales bacterium]|nr:hypothetical protein [Longimicrobiales bacterium]